jgi:DNA-binding response OmpR family regulator
MKGVTSHVANLAVIAHPSESSLSWIPAALAERGGRQLTAADGLKAFELARGSGVELIVLVEPLAVLTAHAVCTALREARVTAPILLLGDSESVAAGLLAGADVVLPLDSTREVVLAQIDALLRRVALEHSPLQVGDLILDTQSRRAERGGNLIPLSGTEYTLLELLMRRAGRVVSREEILEHVWPGESRATDNVLDVYISYLRTKIDRDYSVSLIRTVRGRGYLVAGE